MIAKQDMATTHACGRHTRDHDQNGASDNASATCLERTEALTAPGVMQSQNVLNNNKEQRLHHQYSALIDDKSNNLHFSDGDDEDDDSDDDDQYEQAMDIFVKQHFEHHDSEARLRERRSSLPTEDIELTTFSNVVMRRKQQPQGRTSQQHRQDINDNIDGKQHLMPNKPTKGNRPLSISSISSAASSGSSASSNSSSSSGIHSSLTRNSSLNYSQDFKRNLSYLESVESLNISGTGNSNHSNCHDASSQQTLDDISSKSTSDNTSGNIRTHSGTIAEALKNLSLTNAGDRGNLAQTRAAILAAGEKQRRSFSIHPSDAIAPIITGHNNFPSANESKLSRINRTFHASLRYDKSTAYRIHLMANARAFGLGGQAKSYNLSSAGGSDGAGARITSSEPRGVFRRYSTVSRHNSATSSDSGHSSGLRPPVKCQCNVAHQYNRRKSAEEPSPSNHSSSSLASSFATYARGNINDDSPTTTRGKLNFAQAATLDGAMCQKQHHPDCPIAMLASGAHAQLGGSPLPSGSQRPLRASPKLHPSPSSVSSYSNTSSLFRDDGFEDDLTSTASEHSSSITSSHLHHHHPSNYHNPRSPGRHVTIISNNNSNNNNLINNNNTGGNNYHRLRIHNDQELPLLSISQRVVTEIIETERSYVDDLEQIVSGYLCRLRDALDQHQELFSNLEDVYKFNKDFLFQLEECYLNPGSIAACFVENASKFDVYTHYCTMYPQVVSTLTQLMAQPNTAQILKERQLELNQSLPLGAYLLKPVQRILKYHILFKSLIKHTTDDETVNEKDRESINEAFSVMTDIACHINEMKKRHEHSIRVQELQSLLHGWEGPDLTTLGELILEDTFKLFSRQKSSRHLLLFDNVLLITKKKRDGSLHYKSHIACSNLMLIETIEGQPLVFNTVPFDNPKALCAFQADNLDKKRDWCLQMKEVIIKSFEVKIPVHVKDLLMSLTKTSASIPTAELNNSKKSLSSEKSGRVLRAPNYLEKKRAKQMDKSANSNNKSKH